MKYLKAGRFLPAFFIACVFCFNHSLHAACFISSADKLRANKIASTSLKAIDGDSLKLYTKAKKPAQIRLIGVNTPEYKQPLANTAKAALSHLINSSEQLYWLKGEQSQDRYGRYLSHLFLSDGRSVESILLSRGLGFLVTMPPNMAYANCLVRQQANAKASKLGVWKEPYFAATDLTKPALNKPLAGGFQQIKAKLTGIRRSKSSLWLELEGDVVLRITRQHQPYFKQANLETLLGKVILASGWVVDRSKQKSVRQKGYAPYMLLLTHPNHLHLAANH